MQKTNDFSGKKALIALTVLLLLYLLRNSFREAAELILPFVLAYFFAFVINALSRRIAKSFCLHGRLPIIITTLIISLSLCFALGVCIKAIVRQAGQLYRFLSENKDMIIQRITDTAQRLFKNKTTNLITTIFKDTVYDFATEIALKTGSVSLGVISDIPGFAVKVFAFVSTLFYCTRDFDYVNRFLSKTVPKNVKTFLSAKRPFALRNIKECLKGYFILFLMTSAELFLLFLLIKSPAALLLSFVVALLDALPVFGVGAVLVPWSVFAFFGGQKYKAAILFFGFLLISFVRNIAEPKIISSKLGVHPLVMLFCVYLCFFMYGAIGLFLAPIVAITAKILFFDKTPDIHM